MIYDTGDPIEDATSEGDVQESFAQDVDSAIVQNGTIWAWGVSGGPVPNRAQAEALAVGGGGGFFANDTSIAFGWYRSPGSGVQCINPPGINATVPITGGSPFGPLDYPNPLGNIEGSSFLTAAGLITGSATMSFLLDNINPNNNNPITAQYYAYIGDQATNPQFGCGLTSSFTFYDNFFFQPGTWQVQYTGGNPLNAGGQVQILCPKGNVAVSSFDSTTGWSALAGQANTFQGQGPNIVIPSGGGFLKAVLNFDSPGFTSIPYDPYEYGGNVGLSVTLTFLHA